jgi:laccase
MLRLVTAELNDELFFGVATTAHRGPGGHASYVKTFASTTVVISPGQTMDVLLTEEVNPESPAFRHGRRALRQHCRHVRQHHRRRGPRSSTPPQRATALRGSLPLPPLLAYNDTVRWPQLHGKLPEPGERAVPNVRAWPGPWTAASSSQSG